MERTPLVTRLRECLSDRSSRTLRRVLTGFWILSIVAMLGAAVAMMTIHVPDLPAVHESGPLGAYALPAGLSFVSQYVDATLGMGYGTTLTALLVMLGFPVTQVVVAVLLQQLVAGGIASIAHHALGNADLRPGSFHFRLAMLLGAVAIVGSFVAASVAVTMPERILDGAVGVVILAMGLVIFAARHVRLRFSWWRTGVLGLIAGANKGFMGGGYGPIIVAGQIATGDGMGHAVAVTALSEALGCVGGVAGYAVAGAQFPWALTASLLAGGIIASVFAAVTVRALPEGGLKSVVAATYLVLGALTLYAGLS